MENMGRNAPFIGKFEPNGGKTMYESKWKWWEWLRNGATTLALVLCFAAVMIIFN